MATAAPARPNTHESIPTYEQVAECYDRDPDVTYERAAEMLGTTEAAIFLTIARHAEAHAD